VVRGAALRPRGGRIGAEEPASRPGKGLARGVLPLGQATGLVHDLPSVAELMERIVTEAEGALGRLTEALGARVGS